MKIYLVFWFATLACATETNYERKRTVQTIYNSKYRIVETPETWADAQQNCQDNGQGNLATIFEDREWDDLVAELKKLNIYAAWIGLNDIDVEDTFKWKGGADAPGGLKHGYRVWCTSEPNNVGDEDCVIIANKQTGSCLNDLKCSEKRAYICEINTTSKSDLVSYP